METRWDFPNSTRCIDGKHVNTECPKNTRARSLNYKMFSTVLLAICDAHYSYFASVYTPVLFSFCTDLLMYYMSSYRITFVVIL